MLCLVCGISVVITGTVGGGGGGSTPKNPNPKWESLVVLGFLGFF